MAPRELAGTACHHPVVISGAGPVGLAAAACLARFGIRTVVLEKSTRAGEGSRAICLARRSLEILDWIGVAERFVSKGLGWTRGHAFHGAHPIHELCMPHSDAEKFFPMTNLQQYYMEEFLAQHCARQEEIELRWGNELVGIQPEPDGVQLRVATTAGMYQTSCSWLLAADGARSPARRLLQLPLCGSSFAGRYLIADIRLRSSYPTERRAWFDPPSNPGSTVLMHRQPEDIWRIDYQLQEHDDDRRESEPHRVRERVQRHLDFIGEHGEWELLWTSIYRAHSLALESYVHGHVLFAGDAAHLVPIFGVRGLNSGLADAQNVAWKLAWVLRGDAPERLLHSYSSERRNATLDIHRQAEKSTRFMTPSSLGERLMRAAVLSLASRHEFVRPLIDPRQSVPYTYAGSELNTPEEAAAGLEAFRSGPAPGAPLHNLRIRGHSGPGYLLERLGTGFTVLLFLPGKWTGAHAECLEQLRAVTRLDSRGELRLLVLTGAPPAERDSSEYVELLQDVAGVAPQIYDARPGTVYLARPDGHVCARWRAATVRDVGVGLCRACTVI